MALKQVKSKINATKKTGQVTKAMEAVSAVKMRKSQEKAFSGRPYVRSALRILSQLSNSRDGIENESLKQNASGKKLLVLVTSDKGLAGSVNSSVLKKADEFLAKGEKFDVVTIGRKASEYASRMKLNKLAEYTNVSDDVELKDVTEMAKIIFGSFQDSEYKEVEIIYQNFISTFEQEAIVRRILPLDTEEITSIMKGIRPKTGRWSDDLESLDNRIDYLVEPSVGEVLSTLIPQLVQIVIYHALLESKASEHSARMVAMKNATDKAKEVVKNLTILYNKERQAAITAEVSEITGGIEAMKN